MNFWMSRNTYYDGRRLWGWIENNELELSRHSSVRLARENNKRLKGL